MANGPIMLRSVYGEWLEVSSLTYGALKPGEGWFDGGLAGELYRAPYDLENVLTGDDLPAPKTKTITGTFFAPVPSDAVQTAKWLAAMMVSGTLFYGGMKLNVHRASAAAAPIPGSKGGHPTLGHVHTAQGVIVIWPLDVDWMDPLEAMTFTRASNGWEWV